MRLAVLYPEHLGQHQARLLQTAATCRALARAGSRVHLVVGGFRGLERRLGELGLMGVDGLSVEEVAMCQAGPGSLTPVCWHGVYHRAALSRLRRLAQQGLQAVLLRHVKLADYLLGRLPQDVTLAYEAHELFAATAEEQGMAADKLAALAQREERVLFGADVVLPISKPLATALEKRGLPGPLIVAPSGVDREFIDVPQDRRETGLAVYAGGLAAWKGVDTLVKAVAQAPSAKLEIWGGEEGSASWSRLAGLGQELELTGRMLMRPRRPQSAVRGLLARASVAVWPGTARQRIAAEFTSPLKLFEYLAAGCPVIAPDLPAARAVLTHGENALLFAPDDPASLAEALERVLGDAQLAQALGKAGRELAKGYTWEARAKAILAALGEPGGVS